MNEKQLKKQEQKKQRREQKKLKKNALVLCRGGDQFWTTQKQFWQWLREGKLIKMSDGPLTGKLVSDHEDKLIVLANTVLNMNCPNHLREAMSQRKFAQLR